MAVEQCNMMLRKFSDKKIVRKKDRCFPTLLLVVSNTKADIHVTEYPL